MKQIICPECDRKVDVYLRVGELEFKDGYHGECPGPHCGFWYFEEYKTNNSLERTGKGPSSSDAD